jgi:hypothetical protein
MKTLRLIFYFTMAATMVLALLPGGAVLAVTDTLGPVTSDVLLDPNPATVNTILTVTATVDDTSTGSAIIQSAEFSVNGGPWTAMTAVDNTFDAVSENVNGSFTATPVGTYDVCVHGTDALNNIGEPACASLTVQSLYIFSGFKSPIKMGIANKANAPQTIPVKWLLTLAATGAVVKDQTSFVALKSYAVDCTTLTGDISTAVVEKGPGKAGLKYLGAGKWRFNWKTPKTYRHTCRNMFVLFSDGLMSPEVSFIFK